MSRKLSACTQKISTLPNERGFTLPTVIAIMLAMMILSSAVMMVVINNLTFADKTNKQQQALNIAEAGINYYLWHMSHDANDYKDGNKTSNPTPDPKLGYGPYTHDYYDTLAQKNGSYTLWVKPNSDGSTVVNVRSIGKAVNGSIRTIDAKIGAASFASYGLVSDVEFWFGSNETANGPVFSNQGIHMDGLNTDTVESANSRYAPGVNYGGNGSTLKDGVWCSTSVTTPNCATRDKTNWLYPRPTIDFNQVTTALCTMKKVAFANDNSTAAFATATDACNLAPAARSAAYVPRLGTSFSNRKGYYIELNGDKTYDLYKVSSEDDTQPDTASALTKTPVQTGILVPPSGVIFVEDNVWVKTNTPYAGRVTIAAGRLGKDTNSADVTIVGPILYSKKNGQDAIGLVSEQNITIAPYAIPRTGAFTFEIDAATLAQSGSVSYPSTYKVGASCTIGWVSPSQQFVYYGSVATRQNWTWNWSYSPSRPYGCTDAVYDSVSRSYVSGIMNTTTSYDRNLYYAPPPSYPITGGYDVLSWREVISTP